MFDDIFASHFCRSEQYVGLDATNLIQEQDDPNSSPIDDFIRYTRSVIPLGTPDSLGDSDVLGRVLLLGLISGAEMFFRGVLAGIVGVCPLSRQHASQLMVSLASVDYYGKEQVGFGLIEGVSFATEGEIGKYTKKITGIDIPQTGSLAAAIEEFERLSHFRHAAVHARGDLAPRNAHAIGLPFDSRHNLVVRFPELQVSAQVCTNVARAYNRHMCLELLKRWCIHGITDGPVRVTRSKIGRLTSLFRCKEDGLDGAAHARYIHDKVLEVKTKLKTKTKAGK